MAREVFVVERNEPGTGWIPVTSSNAADSSQSVMETLQHYLEEKNYEYRVTVYVPKED